MRGLAVEAARGDEDLMCGLVVDVAHGDKDLMHGLAVDAARGDENLMHGLFSVINPCLAKTMVIGALLE